MSQCIDSATNLTKPWRIWYSNENISTRNWKEIETSKKWINRSISTRHSGNTPKLMTRLLWKVTNNLILRKVDLPYASSSKLQNSVKQQDDSYIFQYSASHLKKTMFQFDFGKVRDGDLNFLRFFHSNLRFYYDFIKILLLCEKEIDDGFCTF